jgi:hypothetical protein
LSESTNAAGLAQASRMQAAPADQVEVENAPAEQNLDDTAIGTAEQSAEAATDNAEAVIETETEHVETSEQMPVRRSERIAQ